MDRASVTLVLLAVSCVPSVDLDLPGDPDTKAYVVHTERGDSFAIDRDDPVTLAVGAEPIFVASLPFTLEELQIPDVLPLDGTRPVAVPTSTVWRSTHDGESTAWIRDDHEAIPSRVHELDTVACWRQGERTCRIVERAIEQCTPVCPAPRDSPSPDPPDTPVVSVGEVPNSSCTNFHAKFDDGTCARIAECEVPEDLPAGVRMTVDGGADLTTVIAANPGVDVFVLGEGDFSGPIDADRPVHLWGRCPEETHVNDVTLSAGGSIGRVRAYGDTAIRGAVEIRSARLGRVVGDTCQLTLSRSRISGGTLLGCRSTLDRVELGVQQLRVVGGELLATNVVGTGGGTFTIRDVGSAELIDVALSGNDRVLTVEGSCVQIVRLSVRGSPPDDAEEESDFDVEVFDGIVSITDARFEGGYAGLRIRGGTTIVRDAIFDGQKSAGVFVSGHVEREAPVVTVDRIAVGNTVSALTAEGIANRIVELNASNVRSTSRVYGLLAKHDSMVRLVQFNFETANLPVRVDDGALVELAHGKITDAKTAAVDLGGGAEVIATNITMSDAPVAVRLTTPTVGKRRLGAQVRGLRTVDAGGIFLASGTTLQLEDFELDGGDEAFHIDDDAALGASRGIATRFEVGVVVDRSRDIRAMFDGVLIQGVSDENLVKH